MLKEIEKIELKSDKYFTFTPTRLEIKQDTPFEVWEKCGEILRKIDGASRWWLGDWLNFGEGSFEHRYAQALNKTDYEDKGLQNLARTCLKIEPARRRAELSFSHHMDVAALEPNIQDKLLKNAETNDLSIQEFRKEIRKEKHNKPALPLPKGKFNVIYADPPWRYEFSETNTREIENKYPTMELEEIKAQKVPSAEDSILLLWATAPKLEEALEVMNAWGFKYRTCAVWDKEKIGMGYWFRGQHELLLLGIKGEFSTPEESIRYSSVIREKRTEHSKKPEKVYEMIETMFPDGKGLELFNRGGAYSDYWVVWGNETI